MTELIKKKPKSKSPIVRYAYRGVGIAGYFVIMMCLLTEVVVFAGTLIPYFADILFRASVLSVYSGEINDVGVMMYWNFPVMFLVVVFGLLHYAFFRFVISKMNVWFRGMWALGRKVNDCEQDVTE